MLYPCYVCTLAHEQWGTHGSPGASHVCSRPPEQQGCEHARHERSKRARQQWRAALHGAIRNGGGIAASSSSPLSPCPCSLILPVPHHLHHNSASSAASHLRGESHTPGLAFSFSTRPPCPPSHAALARCQPAACARPPAGVLGAPRPALASFWRHAASKTKMAGRRVAAAWVAWGVRKRRHALGVKRRGGWEVRWRVVDMRDMAVLALIEGRTGGKRGRGKDRRRERGREKDTCRYMQ